MKSTNKIYKLEGECSINTTIKTQQDVLSDIRSITGVTIVSFEPFNKDQISHRFVEDNMKYNGTLTVKVDNFPFGEFDKKKHIKQIIEDIRKMPAVNYFRPNKLNLMEEEFEDLTKYKEWDIFPSDNPMAKEGEYQAVHPDYDADLDGDEMVGTHPIFYGSLEDIKAEIDAWEEEQFSDIREMYNKIK